MSTSIIGKENTYVYEIKTKYQDRDIIWCYFLVFDCAKILFIFFNQRKTGHECFELQNRKHKSNCCGYNYCVCLRIPSSDLQTLKLRNSDSESPIWVWVMSVFFLSLREISQGGMWKKTIIFPCSHSHPHLPKKEVAEANLSRCADEQIRIGRVIAVQTLTEQRFWNIAEHHRTTQTLTY